MSPDFLIDRAKVMGILDIKSTVKFNAMRDDGVIPPAVGKFKRVHLWSNTIIQEFKKTADKQGGEYSRDLVATICCEGLIRLTENGTFNVNSTLL